MRRVRELLDQFETLSAPRKKAAASSSHAEIAAAQAGQLEAQEMLRDWFNTGRRRCRRCSLCASRSSSGWR